MSKDLSKWSPDGPRAVTPGLRAAVKTYWRLQISKPDPVILMSRETCSASAGAKSGNEVGLAGAKNTGAARPPLSPSGLPPVPSAGAVGTCQQGPDGAAGRRRQVSVQVASASPPGVAAASLGACRSWADEQERPARERSVSNHRTPRLPDAAPGCDAKL